MCIGTDGHQQGANRSTGRRARPGVCEFVASRPPDLHIVGRSRHGLRRAAAPRAARPCLAAHPPRALFCRAPQGPLRATRGPAGPTPPLARGPTFEGVRGPSF